MTHVQRPAATGLPDDLYSTDALAWAEQQAGLLARLAQGERVNEAVDWANVVEEVRDVGLSELRAVRSLLRRAMEHLMKLRAYPTHVDAEHWQIEIIHFLLDASSSFAPSMRQRIDLEALYRQAKLTHGRLKMGGLAPQPLRAGGCPYALDELIVVDDAIPDIDSLADRLKP